MSSYPQNLKKGHRMVPQRVLKMNKGTITGIQVGGVNDLITSSGISYQNSYTRLVAIFTADYLPLYSWLTLIALLNSNGCSKYYPAIINTSAKR